MGHYFQEIGFLIWTGQNGLINHQVIKNWNKYTTKCVVYVLFGFVSNIIETKSIGFIFELGWVTGVKKGSLQMKEVFVEQKNKNGNFKEYWLLSIRISI